MTTDRANLEVLVVGGSLAGLMTALSLAELGATVTVLERTRETRRTGAAIHIPAGLLRRVAGKAASDRDPLPVGVQAWATAYRALSEVAATHPRLTLHRGVKAVAASQDDASAWVIAADGDRFSADLVVGADGHRSAIRAAVAPERPDARFAGYTLWLGLVDESAIDVALWPHAVAFLEAGSACLLGYPLPASDGSEIVGARQLGWAWYDADHNELLRREGCVVDGVVRHSLSDRRIPEATYDELRRGAAVWSSPWREAVLDSIAQRSVICTPIAEYVPERLVRGRIALVGDAAHVPTPMTGSGFDASLHDAESLARMLAAGDRASVPRALLNYERDRLADARGLVLSGQRFSRGFAHAA